MWWRLESADGFGEDGYGSVVAVVVGERLGLTG